LIIIKNNFKKMAKIVDPDQLTKDIEVVFDTAAKTIQVIEIGNITAIDGVTLQCIYSFCKEQWKTDAELIKYPFPLIAITAEQFEFFNSWSWADTTSKEIIRDGGWAVKDGSGISEEEYMNLTTLGSFNASSDTSYYLQSSGGTSTPTVYSAEVNQAIQIYGDASNGDVDYRTYFSIFLREQAKIFDYYNLMAEQNLTELTYKKYALPLSNSTDLKITHDDTTIGSSSPYNGMSITYYESAVQRTIGSSDYDFSVIVDGNSGTAEEIYEFVQYQLRLNDNIDNGVGSLTGKTADELLLFIGDTLRTTGTVGEGVFIDNYLSADINRLEFTESGGTIVSFPYVASGSFQFNDNLTNDASALYWLFFTDANGNTYDSTNAIIINDNSSTPLNGAVTQQNIAFDYDYDGNTQGGRTEGTDAPYTAVAIGLDTGQYVKTTGSLTRTTSNVVNFVAALERNYSNPA